MRTHRRARVVETVKLPHEGPDGVEIEYTVRVEGPMGDSYWDLYEDIVPSPPSPAVRDLLHEQAADVASEREFQRRLAREDA